MRDSLPLGGVTARKYAAMCLALAMARGALYSVIVGDLDGVKEIVDLTSTEAVAAALGCSEAELAVIWDDHLSNAELNRIKGFGGPVS